MPHFSKLSKPCVRYTSLEAAACKRRCYYKKNNCVSTFIYAVQVLELRAALAEAVAEGRASAAAAEGLVAPVAARKLRQEVEQVMPGRLYHTQSRYKRRCNIVR